MSATQQRPRSIRELTAGHTVVGFITIGEDGKPNCRAMTTQEADPDMDLWFATRLDSEKVDELRKNPNVGLYYYNAGRGRISRSVAPSRLSRTPHDSRNTGKSRGAAGSRTAPTTRMPFS